MPLWSVDAQTNVSTMVHSAMQTISSTCHNTTNIVSSISDVSVHITGVSCADISVFNQSVQADATCDSNAALNSITKTLTDMAQANKKSGVTALTGGLLAGVNLQTDVSTNKNILREKLNSICANKEQSIQSINGATVDMSGVSCDDLKIFQQQTSFTAQCMFHAAMTSMDQDTVKQTQSMTTHGFSFMAIFLIFIGVVLLYYLAKWLFKFFAKASPYGMLMGSGRSANQTFARNAQLAAQLLALRQPSLGMAPMQAAPALEMPAMPAAGMMPAMPAAGVAAMPAAEMMPAAAGVAAAAYADPLERLTQNLNDILQD